MKVGTRVRATRQIVEDDQAPDPKAAPCMPGWVHAKEGDEGQVSFVEPLGNVSAYPDEENQNTLAVTVVFDQTKTATLVLEGEVVELD